MEIRAQIMPPIFLTVSFRMSIQLVPVMLPRFYVRSHSRVVRVSQPCTPLMTTSTKPHLRPQSGTNCGSRSNGEATESGRGAASRAVGGGGDSHRTDNGGIKTPRRNRHECQSSSSYWHTAQVQDVHVVIRDSGDLPVSRDRETSLPTMKLSCIKYEARKY